MSLKGTLLKWGFFEEEEETSAKQPVKQDIQQPTSQVPVSVAPPSQVSVNGFDAQMIALIKENNLPGPDYFEFSEALSKLDGKPLTEEQKYENINLTFEAIGVQPEKLVESANHYIEKLDDLKQQFADEVAEANQKISDVNDKISKNEKEIARLTQLVQQDRLFVDQSKQKIAENQSSFNIAFDQRVNTIKDHISKIKNYLLNASTKS